MSTLFQSMQLTGLRKAHLQQLLSYVEGHERDYWYTGKAKNKPPDLTAGEFNRREC